MEEPSTDALLNAGGESTDGVQDLLASLMDSGYPEGIAAEIQHSIRAIASLFIMSSLGVWTIPHFISCSSQFSASSSMSEHLSGIQWLVYLSMWGTCPSSLCHLSCPIVELLEQDDLSNLQQ